ncbi:unnamed protein product [Polarella glacialis]|uniref:Uncharacterized protein n=1 Tax=Polarella glacialis TaxID=89957 RepID=A0A813IXX1_POLGL|nr:unnamed protein product [Polarella glacialis]
MVTHSLANLSMYYKGDERRTQFHTRAMKQRTQPCCQVLVCLALKEQAVSSPKSKRSKANIDPPHRAEEAKFERAAVVFGAIMQFELPVAVKKQQRKGNTETRLLWLAYTVGSNNISPLSVFSFCCLLLVLLLFLLLTMTVKREILLEPTVGVISQLLPLPLQYGVFHSLGSELLLTTTS